MLRGHGTSVAEASRNMARIILASLALVVAMAGMAAAAPAEGDPTQHFNFTDLGYGDKNVAGGPLEAGDQPMSPPMILMLMNFGIVLFLIGWKVRPKVTGYLKGRHESIKGALEEAARLREAAQGKLDEYTRMVSAAEAELDQMVKDMRADAEAEKKRIIAEAEAQAEALQRDAKARIDAEIERARAMLEREVTAAAVAAAESILRKQATAEDHTRLIDSFIGDVQADARASRQERV